MRVIKITPEICKQKGSDITGTVEITMPNYVQRLSYIKECNFTVNKDEGELKVSSTSSNIDSLVKMVELAKPHITKVDLRVGNEEIKSFEEMMDYSECDEIINELAGVILNGVKLGKK